MEESAPRPAQKCSVIGQFFLPRPSRTTRMPWTNSEKSTDTERPAAAVAKMKIQRRTKGANDAVIDGCLLHGFRRLKHSRIPLRYPTNVVSPCRQRTTSGESVRRERATRFAHARAVVPEGIGQPNFWLRLDPAVPNGAQSRSPLRFV